jgi:DNA-binding PadR family transcriptional regulator
MYELTKTEEVLLIAIWQLEDKAYGVNIRRHVSELVGKEFTYGNLYSALNQLTRKKYVTKVIGEPTPERRGRPKVFYTINKEGRKALKAAQEMNNALWANVPEYAFE